MISQPASIPAGVQGGIAAPDRINITID